MLGAVIGLLTALPRLLDLATTVWAWIQKSSGGDVEGFISRVNDAFVSLNKAKTNEEYADAARKIRDAIRNPPS
jgi:hypothetical protein